MRATPLALLDVDAGEDASITNPNSVNIDCNRVYVAALRRLLHGEKISVKDLLDLALTNDVKATLQQVLDDEQRDVTQNKGWVLHGLYCAAYVLHNYTSFDGGMDWIMSKEGDGYECGHCRRSTGCGSRIGCHEARTQHRLQHRESAHLRHLHHRLSTAEGIYSSRLLPAHGGGPRAHTLDIQEIRLLYVYNHEANGFGALNKLPLR
jgi:hypothetical protein